MKTLKDSLLLRLLSLHYKKGDDNMFGNSLKKFFKIVDIEYIRGLSEYEAYTTYTNWCFGEDKTPKTFDKFKKYLEEI